MCWSAEGSLGTYTAGMLLAALAKNRLDPRVWIFMTLFTHIQLVEYFLWKNLHVPRLNSMWSAVGLALILAEPAASLNLLGDVRLVVAYTLGCIVYILTQKIDFTTVVGGNGHLKWNWAVMEPRNIGVYIWLCIFLLPLYVTKNYLLFIAGLVTLAISAFFNTKYGTISSYWCWINIFSWVIPFLKK
ncbi:hypothetical protein EBT25_05645 [bacterium]|jgi:hypothetical protein|nr:hypothetical protein [bacterium]